jgi:hypothetical protein
MNPSEPVTVTAHPPERRRGGRSVVLPCGCCCCCCCCLHSVGGLIGGLAGSIATVNTPPPQEPDGPFPFRRDYEEDDPLVPPAMLYWLIVLFGSAVVTVVPFVADGFKNPEQLLIGGVIALMVFPGVQLAASLVAFLIAAFAYRDRRRAAVRLAKITGWSFVGGLAGTFVMFVLCAGFGAFR